MYLPMFLCRAFGISVPCHRLLGNKEPDTTHGLLVQGDETAPVTTVVSWYPWMNVIRRLILVGFFWKRYAVIHVGDVAIGYYLLYRLPSDEAWTAVPRLFKTRYLIVKVGRENVEFLISPIDDDHRAGIRLVSIGSLKESVVAALADDQGGAERRKNFIAFVW